MNTTNTTRHFVLEADTFDEDDETVSSEELDHDLDAALMQTEAYRRGEVPQRVTEFVDGRVTTYWRFVDGPAADRYRVVIEWSRQKAVFMATMPQLRGCTAQGRTQQEALLHIREAAYVWMDEAVTEGRDIPLPVELSAAA